MVKAKKKYGAGGKMKYGGGGKMKGGGGGEADSDDALIVGGRRSYNMGGKVVAQGADKKDVRREKKHDRRKKRADRASAKAVKKAKRVGDRNFKRDVKSGKLKKVGEGMVAGAKAGAKKGDFLQPLPVPKFKTSKTTNPKL